jgi:hypothetical protein
MGINLREGFPGSLAIYFTLFLLHKYVYPALVFFFSVIIGAVHFGFRLKLFTGVSLIYYDIFTNRER